MTAVAGTDVTRLDPDARARMNVAMVGDHAAAEYGGNCQDPCHCRKMQRFH
ncbi:MAG TPA: hypothetical protein VJW76_14605 [Verrucomicrobiae bacterium]|nr:hypothetical protein [Verrucomicrobiae bacterium]